MLFHVFVFYCVVLCCFRNRLQFKHFCDSDVSVCCESSRTELWVRLRYVVLYSTVFGIFTELPPTLQTVSSFIAAFQGMAK